MYLILFISLMFITYIAVCCIRGKSFNEVVNNKYFVIALVGFVVHLIATFIHDGHPTDMTCFKSWANQLYNDGFSNFYISEGFTDYPPGYMYVLYVIGFIRNLFDIEYASYTYSLLVKLPAIIADILSGFFIYWLAKRKMSDKMSLICAMFYVVNPVIVLNSAVWGQVDSIHTLILAISIYYIIEKKLLYSSILFVIGAIIKPQSFMLSPIYMYVFFMYLKENQWSKKAFFTLFKYAGICLIVLVLLSLPFASYKNGYPDLTPVIDQYISTIVSYGYTTINAYNIYGLFSLNWVPLEQTFLGISYTIWGGVALVSIVIFAFFLLAKIKADSKYFYTAMAITMCTFMFSVKMHERYCFPALMFLILTYVYRRNRYILYVFVAFTVSFFAHYVDILAMSINDFNYSQIDKTMVYFSVLMMASFIFMMIATPLIYKNNADDNDIISDENNDSFEIIPSKYNIKLKDFFKTSESNEDNNISYRASEEPIRYNRFDAIFLAVITAVYTVVAFSNLGNMTGAQNPWIAENSDSVLVDFGQVYSLSRVQYMTNAKQDQKFTVFFSTDGINFENGIKVQGAEYTVGDEVKYNDANSVFSWEDISTPYEAQYAMIIANNSEFRINEIAFRTDSGELVPISNVNGVADAENLFDEQDLVPDMRTEYMTRYSYMTSTYFDEIFHARTAYEFLNSLNIYEWTHPPLGKLIISVGISIFGMTPFGWRFMGTLFGVIMLPVIYVFARKMFKDPKWAAFATTIFAFDFMHYAQTRLATIDTYITFFVILMYYFMYKYCTLNYNDENTKFRKTLIPLAFSGLFMGFGIASKWPGAYAGIGLAVIFFAHIIGRAKEYFVALERPSSKNSYIRSNFPKYTIFTLLWCVVFFAIVPVAIYVASYIQYYFGDHGLYQYRDHIRFLSSNPELANIWPDNTFFNFIAAVVQNQIDMYTYHSKTVVSSTHPYSSEWWKWPLNIRPIFYYSNTISDELRQGISAFGNPAVWVIGFVALIVTAISAFINKSRKSMFLLIAYLAQFTPWMLVARTTYIYHYFPCVPFLALMLTYCFKSFLCRKNMIPAYIFAGIVVILFIMFYPILTGTNVNIKYVKDFLEWLPSWHFVS